MVLERIFEISGLRKGVEYDAQQRYKLDSGTWAQPDIVIHLPENKDLVIDSKVSLVAYENYVNADDENTRADALGRHIASVRKHIDELAEAGYQRVPSLNTLDFVIMFVPIESAFMLAIANDSSLWQDAWRKSVILVSPSTLLFAVRTIASIWRQEYQNRNVQEIAKRGAELYDKFVGFIADLQRVGDKLAEARETYQEAQKKFMQGRGNLIRQAEMLRELGVKPTKSLPRPVIEAALEEAEASDQLQPALTGN
jgi:DNA recombination protein RmuC